MFGWLRNDAVDRTGGDGNNERDGKVEHLALYKYDSCPYCRRVFAVIDRLDVNIEYRDITQHTKWRQELVKLTGRSQVPCLAIDDVPLLESAHIAAFLSKHYATTR